MQRLGKYFHGPSWFCHVAAALAVTSKWEFYDSVSGSFVVFEDSQGSYNILCLISYAVFQGHLSGST